MPRLHAEALFFSLAWAALAFAGGLLAGWTAGVLLSAGLLVVIMPTSALLITRTDNLDVERWVRWAILIVAGFALVAYINL